MTYNPRKIRLLMALRGAGVTDTRVLAAIERIPRELFVPEAFQDRAWEDTALPIDQGQTISQPLVVGLMTQALELLRDILSWRSEPVPAIRRRCCRGSAAGSSPSSG